MRMGRVNLTLVELFLSVAGLAEAADDAGGLADRVVLTLSERLRGGVRRLVPGVKRKEARPVGVLSRRLSQPYKAGAMSDSDSRPAPGYLRPRLAVLSPACTLARQRQAGAQAGAAVRPRGQRDRPAERAHALADADEPDPARAARAVVRRQPDPVVAHLEPELVSLAGERHPHALRVRVAGDVGERLLDDAVDRGLDLLREALLESLGGELRRDLVPPAEGFEVRLDRPREPVEIEPGRAQQLRELAHLAEGLGDQASRLARPRAELAQVGRELPLEQPEVRGHRGERLPELVVQLAREPAELLLLHGDEARGERGELVLALDQARSEATQD